MAVDAINLNEKLPSAEEDVENSGEALTLGSSDPLPAAGTAAGGTIDVSAQPPTAPSDGSKASEGAEESKRTVAVNGSSASVNDVERKIQRAKRFGVPVQLSEAEKRNSRAERFGTGSDIKKPESLSKLEELKRKARAERFGISVSEVVNEEVKKKARLAKFASNVKTISDEEEKRKARAIRFSNILSPISQVNSKAAVAGGGSGRA